VSFRQACVNSPPLPAKLMRAQEANDATKD
jgi:hypothetical protein